MKKKAGLLVKIKGYLALAKLKRAKKLPKNSRELYRRIKKAGLG